MKKCISALVFCLIFEQSFSMAADAGNSKLPENTGRIVGLISDNQKHPLGTGFLYAEKWVYISTAKHVLVNPANNQIRSASINFVFHVVGDEESIPEMITVSISTSGVSQNTFLGASDVAAIRVSRFYADKVELASGVSQLPAPLKDMLRSPSHRSSAVANKTNCRLFDDVSITDDVIYFGYPALPTLDGTPQYDFAWPLYRRGMVSGKFVGRNKFVIDGVAQPGNSGGPVFVVEDSTIFGRKAAWLVGITTDRTLELAISTATQVVVNAGYSLVEPIDSIIKLIADAER